MRRNQRNSRARKQAYLKDLEHRWNECLRLGVQASADMQQAARKVSHENEQLRKMLHERGLTDDMIKDELLSSPTTGGPSDYSSASKLFAKL
ncbi:hypothetical protein BDY21DRAFT_374518 [Lineolata rhizophorae]|uniref:BZIP domain-containing protein n=1 Tax=Lineolata rhizophorae TaxID=578093 RepID=A0A6A6NQM3_9PEZI|nr:hypothetical protein BDY21DRAFT_374518 [Lineolata rhizophorae]